MNLEVTDEMLAQVENRMHVTSSEADDDSESGSESEAQNRVYQGTFGEERKVAKVVWVDARRMTR